MLQIDPLSAKRFGLATKAPSPSRVSLGQSNYSDRKIQPDATLFLAFDLWRIFLFYVFHCQSGHSSNSTQIDLLILLIFFPCGNILHLGIASQEVLCIFMR